jgi:putative ABC transport system permease protein
MVVFPGEIIVRALILRPLIRERLRSILTILGIAVGVAVVVAIQLANQSALRSFRESVDAIAGRANFQIVSAIDPIDETLLLALRPLWSEGVRFAPVIDVEGVAETGGQQQPIRLLGVDLFSDLHFRDYRYTKIVVAKSDGAAKSLEQQLALFRPDSVIVPKPFAAEYGLDLGSPLVLNVLGNRRTMIVRGILEAEGPGAAFHGAIAIADIASAQHNFGMRGRLSRIDLMVPEERAAELLRRIPLPPGTSVERPSRRNERVERMLRAFRVNLFALAGVALLVGIYLVYNTVLISILRRRREVGIVRTLGASPVQIFAAFVAEGAAFGVIGSVFGVGLGWLMARGILGGVARTINTLYVATAPQEIVLTPSVVASGLLVGVVLSLLSALQPSIEASRIPASIMLRAVVRPRGTRLAVLAAAAIGAFAAGAAATRIPPIAGVAAGGYLAVILVVAGFSLLAPAIVRAAATIGAPILERTFGVPGKLAAAWLPASLRRTATATAALAVATGMSIAVALMIGSFRETVRIWVDQTISSDLWLRPSKGLSNAPNALFPPQVADELERVSFVEDVDRARGRDIVLDDDIVALGSGEFDVAATRGDLPMVTPSSGRQALLEARRTNGVIVSESFAIRRNRWPGDSVTLPVSTGRITLPITGVYRDYSNDRGVIVMDRSLYVRLFDDRKINTIVVYLRPGVPVSDARRDLQRTFGPKYGAFVVTNREVRDEVMTIFDQTFSITWALLAVATIVAVLGIINTLTALILERTRELALLRVGGLLPREMGRMILLESALLGAAATATGVVIGYVLSWILIHVINRQSFGWTIEFHTPVGLVITAATVTLIASVLAGLAPARRAQGINLVTALKEE